MRQLVPAGKPELASTLHKHTEMASFSSSTQQAHSICNMHIHRDERTFRIVKVLDSIKHTTLTGGDSLVVRSLPYGFLVLCPDE